jgi:hypothetical protein
MAFHFRCPQGHVLEGDEANMGLQTQCPFCDVVFVIPVVESPPQEEDSPHEAYDPTAMQPDVREFLEQVVAVPAGRAAREVSAGQVAASTPRVVSAEPLEPAFLHIPCPNGHELESPRDMLGQRVLCPHCNAKFRLRSANSREHREEEEQLDRAQGRFWIKWSVAAAVVIGGSVLVLLLLAIRR